MLLYLMVVATLCSCVSIDKQTVLSNELRQKATDLYQQKEHAKTLPVIERPIRESRYLPHSSIEVIEAYDAAGLYYYLLGNYEVSARYQAIAVLLAHGQKEHRQMYSQYIRRLA